MMKHHRVYLLAAGRGKRAGGPKAWKSHDGKTLLEKQLTFLLGFFPPEAISVSIQEEWLERCRTLNPELRWVPVDPDAAAMSSLHEMMKAAPLDRWSFLYHVDMPLWEKKLFLGLAGRIPGAEEQGADAIVPVRDGRGGHPVLLAPKAGAQLAALDPAAGRLDLWLRGRKVSRVEVPFSCIHENWNSGADAA